MSLSKSIRQGWLIIALLFSSQTGRNPAFAQKAVNLLPDQSVQLFFPLIINDCNSCYFVDSVNGSDANTGTTIDKPWKTLARFNSTKFSPGSLVQFKRGSSWTGGLNIKDSGEMGKPITFKAYGTGNRPVFSNPGDGSSVAIAVNIVASWVIVEDFLVQDSHNEGVNISKGSDHNIVRNIEATNVGAGIFVGGQDNLITDNYIHDLHMVVNTPGGDDDSGAVGIVLNNSNNEISYNQIVNCKGPSYDYGMDGGSVEWWGNADNNYVHHNLAMNSDGFLEVGGGSVNYAIVAYNVSVNNGRFSWFNLSGKYTSNIQNFRIENNTIIESVNNGQNGAILIFNGEIEQNTFLVRNNIFSINEFWAIANKTDFIHEHNLYDLKGGTIVGFPIELSEQIADPLFVSPSNNGFQLLPSSPALDAGINLGYSIDYDGSLVPIGLAPDLGAYEYFEIP